jgi:hypothetical protein
MNPQLEPFSVCKTSTGIRICSSERQRFNTGRVEIKAGTKVFDSGWLNADEVS